MDSLARSIAQSAVLRGSFTLRSGRHSSYYIDKYLFLSQPTILDELGRRFASRLDELGLAPDRLAGAELGGIPLVSVASVHSGRPSVFIRNQKKYYGTAKQLEGLLNPGDAVVILEDVVTSGGQSCEAASVIRGAGAAPLAVLAVIDREEGAREQIEGDGLRFDALFTKTDLGIDDPPSLRA